MLNYFDLINLKTAAIADYSKDSLVDLRDVKIDSGKSVPEKMNDYFEQIRTEEISILTSKISPFVSIREKVLSVQREFAQKFDCVIEGRDIGTVVLPYADYKFFVTASEEVRAKRRFDQIKDKQNVSYEQILKDLQIRDYNDTHRKVAPLIPAKDSIILDTSDFTLDQTVDMCVDIITKNKAK